MKIRTLIELATLSSNLYMLSKDKELMEKLHQMTEKGKDKINSFMSSSVKDENGNEIEFLHKLAAKAHEVKDELEEKIAGMVEEFYKKVNIAHVNEIKTLTTRIEELSREIALLEARVNNIESK